MSEEIKQKIADYLAAHEYLNLATVTAAGTPMAHTVGYTSEGAVVFFVTDGKTRKARNIAGNPAVAYTVDEDRMTSPTETRGVQMEGTASIVTNQEEAGRIIAAILAKFPFLKNMPPNPDMTIYKIQPARCVFIDNTKGFGHLDTVTY